MRINSIKKMGILHIYMDVLILGKGLNDEEEFNVEFNVFKNKINGTDMQQ